MTSELIETQSYNYSIFYRDKLTIPKDVSFGIELELEHVSKDEVYKLVKTKIGRNWQIKEDKSLIEDENAEISSPPLYNTKETWLLLKKLATLVYQLHPTYDNCSFQVNIDGSLLPTDRDKKRFLKLFAVYEDILYRFSKGEDECLRESLDTYAYPIILHIKDFKELDQYLLETYIDQKRSGVCLKTTPVDLIEFRTPNATNNPILWQNYITTFYYLIKYSMSSKCREKELDEYLDNFDRLDLIEYYEKLHMDKAYKLSKKLFRKKMIK